MVSFFLEWEYALPSGFEAIYGSSRSALKTGCWIEKTKLGSVTIVVSGNESTECPAAV